MSFGDENTPKPAGFLARLVVVECKRCGQSYDECAWFDLDLVGYQADVENSSLLELRNCECGTTHSIECDVDESEGRSMLVDAVEALLVPGRKIVLTRDSEGQIVIGAEVDEQIEAYVCGRSGLSTQLLALVDALPARKDAQAELLESLVRDSEPITSGERDTRPESQP